MRTRIFQIVQRAQKDDALSRAYDAFVAAVAFLSIVPLMFRPQDMGPHLAAFMSGLELTSVYVLSFDYLLRWMTYDLKCGKPGWRSFVRYPFTPLAIIDLLSILPSLGVLPTNFLFLRALRVTRVFRYSKHLTIVGNVLKAERRTLLSVLAVALMYVFVCALIMFSNEPGTFDNFLDALYWACITLTTVGYGDVYPTTDLGKIVAMTSSFFGMAVIAMPAGVITSGFLQQVRKMQQDREGYFDHTLREAHIPFDATRARLRDGIRAWTKDHPRACTYLVTMAACTLLDIALYALRTAFDLPLWLDTVGTGLAAILLEPSAGLIVGFADNVVLALQIGSAGDLLYYLLSAFAALVVGTLFARSKTISAKRVCLAFVLLVGVGTLLLFALSRIVTGTALTASAQQAYLTAFLAAHAAEPVAQFLAILVDRTVDTVFTLALVLVLRRAIVGSRIDPQHWTGAIDPNAAHDAVVQPTVPTSTRHVPAVEFLLDEVEEIRTNKADCDTAPERTKPSNGNGDRQ